MKDNNWVRSKINNKFTVIPRRVSLHPAAVPAQHTSTREQERGGDEAAAGADCVSIFLILFVIIASLDSLKMTGL